MPGPPPSRSERIDDGESGASCDGGSENGRRIDPVTERSECGPGNGNERRRVRRNPIRHGLGEWFRCGNDRPVFEGVDEKPGRAFMDEPCDARQAGAYGDLLGGSQLEPTPLTQRPEGRHGASKTEHVLNVPGVKDRKGRVEQ